ncbi:glycine--tRNA ligase subunit beta [Sandarakinorhabdus limnophila]|uniref:glycine--tRNA ligase subunit beta n=1 Tax=Sandarakinorhabdus limnophila TaxID=210512 RepID=UPI0026EF516C|nr:glycine--tRNA ligase subunit beta [Sandarakinorhabdus limnophila]
MKFLLELQSEEIPARMQAAAADQLRTRFVDALKAAGLAHGAVTADATPRRLWLIADDVAPASEGSAEEVKGPAASAPAQAIEGFLKKTGLTRDQLEERETPKGIVLFAMLRREGRTASEILADVIPQIIRDFAWPKSMRWGAASQSTAAPRWVRPLTGIVALLDGDVVACEAHGITSGRETRGHRVHAPGVLSITSAATYLEQLRAAHVLASSAERRRIIATRAAELAAGAGLSLIPDDGLVAENAGLTEWPVPLLGRFDPDFLSVPREVIVLTMRTNQKYFALADASVALAPAFICVANLDATDGGAAITHGNQRVLSARLSDARFFWEQDLATVRAGGLEAFLPKLNDIVFHEKLGTLADKVERVAALAKWLCENDVMPADPAQAERAARLAKADLVSATVGEFPEVQGQIGRYLALAIGVEPAIADAIRDHYKPAGQGDDVPTAPVSVAVALADKLDTLICFLQADMPPTGSKDPFALRRQALGCISVVQSTGTRLSLRKLMQYFTDICRLSISDAGWQPKLLDFFADRLKVQQREAGVRHDLIDAVFALGSEDDLVRLLARVKALQAFVETEDGTNLLAGYKRAANILKAAEKDGIGEPASGEGEGAEALLAAALATALPTAKQAVAEERFTDAMAALASLRGPVDAFFTDVMVNDPDPGIRARRLALLARFRDAVHGVADFSKIEG